MLLNNKMSLPDFIIQKISLYNIHPVAQLLKDKIKYTKNKYSDITENNNLYAMYHYANTFTVLDKIVIKHIIENTKYKNNWSFCCNDTGIFVC